ncbi:LytR/AlgR family response regulator transcription factor [Megalodesulfovibrio gigas]|uniref:Putative LytTR family two component transcriptional regulator n=1 Tax=Megalodesulfovibrio gigas (strain ATCC 19364 / DSM 1382 / NCIMB 9332 / VKM B-1759) TaxID=1121448 RepID=T2GCE0_MEGG1|nr:LytTR family DNA-binding domain-containing protein [Megalodesulfovibrio gigas]AGW13552.1 putative LytTR family two component transcriptional regulator [Megalodesulfovibrio gigas DSM 1382 = ATCC 19364]
MPSFSRPRLDALLLHPDPQVRHALRRALAQSEVVRVLGEAVEPAEALALLEALQHDVCFLGVDLQTEGDGFALALQLARLPRRPALVFVADDEARAFQALELGATDYLRWPCPAARLDKTFDRLSLYKTRSRLIPPPEERWEDVAEEHAARSAHYGDPFDTGRDDDEKTLQLPLEEDEQDRFLCALQQAWDHQRTVPPGPAIDLEKLAISLEGRTILLPYTQIIFIEAVEDYTYVHTASQKFLTSYRLKHLEERLRRHRFFRVHRKYLVNLEMVTEIASLPGSSFMLRTAGKTRIELPISRRRVGELKEMLGL